MKDLNVRPETLEIEEYKTLGEKFLDIDLGNDFLDVTPTIHKKNKYRQVKLHQTKNLLHRKENNQQTQEIPIELEKTFAHILIIHKNSNNSIAKI